MGISRHSAGFTIIEVILFLTVTGVLTMSVFATSTVGINNQRYVDAVNTFKATVQEEFTNTTQVGNTRPKTAKCPLSPATSQPVGASDCVVMGRLMTVDANGNILRSNLVGLRPDVAPTSVSDIANIQSYTPTIDAVQQTTSTMNWGTVVKSGAVSIVIFRSPTSGNVLSFVHKGSVIASQHDLELFMNDPAEFTNNTPRIICIDPSGWTVAETQAVIITPYAAGPSGVEQKTGVAECA
jgi:hypothetical protein